MDEPHDGANGLQSPLRTNLGNASLLLGLINAGVLVLTILGSCVAYSADPPEPSDQTLFNVIFVILVALGFVPVLVGVALGISALAVGKPGAERGLIGVAISATLLVLWTPFLCVMLYIVVTGIAANGDAPL